MNSFTLVVHSDNEQVAKELIRKSKGFAGEIDGCFYIKSHKSCFDMAAVRVRGESFVERSQKTGKFILPGGRVVSADQVNVVNGFITYGPEDLSWLLYAGIVSPEVFYPSYLINDRFNMVNMDLPVFHPDVSFAPEKWTMKVNYDPSPTMFRPKFS